MKKKLIAVICLASIVPSACASLKVTTWILEGGVLNHGPEHKPVIDANGYHCYSEADDTAWRTTLRVLRDCCDGK